MTRHLTHIAAPRGELYWRPEVCPSRGAKVLLRTIGGTCVVGQWYGGYGEAFTDWSPMPKDGAPAPLIEDAGLWARIRYAFKLIFNPSARAHHPRKP